MKLISYFLSLKFTAVFFLILLVFHPIQWIALTIFGFKAHTKVIESMNYLLYKSLLTLGVPVKIENPHKIPLNKTLIIVANHQSLFDIPPIIWHFRKHFPKFVAKKELAKGIPSVSYSLRNGGAALIDRKNSRQALVEISNFGKKIQTNNWSAVIFPEGTRSKTGQPKPFQKSGLKMLLKKNPEALLVPITINNSWKIFKYGKFPFGIGSAIKMKVHKPVEVNSLPLDQLITTVETTIKQYITNKNEHTKHT